MKRLGMGCMRFPCIAQGDENKVDIEQVKKMVDTFIEKGFTYFDTAYMYHDGESERIVKEVLVDRYPRESFMLATKMPTMRLEIAEDMERIFNEQLEKTGAGYFDYYLIHALNRNSYKTAQELDTFGYVFNKKAEGKIKRVGFSFHDSPEILDKILTEHPETEFVQLQINYLDWENRDVQSRMCYEVALKHNKEIIIMEPVKGGALANLPKEAELLFKKANPNMSMASWAVRFSAGLKNVIMVLSGMSNMEQLVDNMSFMDDFVSLTDDEIKLCFKAAEIINLASTIPCTSCRYCVDGCPIKIDIPRCFTAFNNVLKNEKNYQSIKADYLHLIENTGSADACIGCKKCEGVCPQHIAVSEELKKVVKMFR